VHCLGKKIGVVENVFDYVSLFSYSSEAFFYFFKSADTMAMLYASMAHPFSTPSLN